MVHQWMGVLPIRKTAPDTVALTSFYGKNFIRRSEKSAYDRPKWLVNEIVSRGFDTTDMSITDVKFSNVFDMNAKVPRDYSAIAMRLSGFVAGDATYSFNYPMLEQVFGAKVVAEMQAEELTPIATTAKAVLGMDKFGTVYRKAGKEFTELGKLTDVLAIDVTKAPREFTELSMMGKSIPLGVILSYYHGLEGMLTLFKVPYRTTEAGDRFTARPDELLIKLTDRKVVISPETPEQTLLVNGLYPYLKLMRDFSLRDMNGSDVYLNLIQKDGLTNRYLNELDLMDRMFIDPITERILKKMGEPITFQGLLRRSNELLTTDSHPRETDMDQMHLFGMQRIPGAIYTELTRAVRDYRNKPGSRKRLELPTTAVWTNIAQDPSVMPSSDANPIQSIKEADVVTFGGNGGRSRRSMVKHTREFLDTDQGVISEATVDSGDVAVTSYLTSNPIFDDVDGLIQPVDRSTLDVNRVVSSYAMLAPGSLYDRRFVSGL